RDVHTVAVGDRRGEVHTVEVRVRSLATGDGHGVNDAGTGRQPVHARVGDGAGDIDDQCGGRGRGGRGRGCTRHHQLRAGRAGCGAHRANSDDSHDSDDQGDGDAVQG